MAEVTHLAGRYELFERVGRGGMAVVYRARQMHPRRLVAVKELRALHDDDPSYALRFLREADLAGALSHPNIVTVYDYFEHDGTPYIAMEYVEGGSLRPYLGRMSLAQIVGVLEGLLGGLMHAERARVVHRDLKPENVMVTSEGHVKITDFGIAKATTQLQTGEFLTATGLTVGTPRYMGPEQAMAQEIGPWTDLYSLGCMAFEMLTGRGPFDDSDAPMAILMRHINEPIPPVRSIEPAVDEGLSAWVGRLLVKDPEERTRSAREAWHELEEIVIGLLGPRWRRDGRLEAGSAGAGDSAPLTPPPFEGTADEIPGPYTPPPADLPPGPMLPTSAPADYETFRAAVPARPAEHEPPASDLAPPSEPDPTLPPSKAATSLESPPAARPRRRRRAAMATAATLVVVAAGVVALIGGGSDGRKLEQAARATATPTTTPSPTPTPAPDPEVSAAEARDSLDRFVGRFRAEDLSGLKRLFAPEGAVYEYAGSDALPDAAVEYGRLFKQLQVADYRLSNVRISTSGTYATVQARYAYGDRGDKTDAGRPWLHTGTITLYLLDDGEDVGITRIVAHPSLVLTAEDGAPTTIRARATIGTEHRILVGVGAHAASGRRALPGDPAQRDRPGKAAGRRQDPGAWQRFTRWPVDRERRQYALGVLANGASMSSDDVCHGELVRLGTTGDAEAA